MNLVLISGTKLDGYRGTWSGCPGWLFAIGKILFKVTVSVKLTVYFGYENFYIYRLSISKRLVVDFSKSAIRSLIKQDNFCDI